MTPRSQKKPIVNSQERIRPDSPKKHVDVKENSLLGGMLDQDSDPQHSSSCLSDSDDAPLSPTKRRRQGPLLPQWVPQNSLYLYRSGDPLPLARALNLEIRDFVDWIKPTPQEVQQRADIADNVSRLCKKVFKKCDVQVFGSTRCDISLPTSDIDVTVLMKCAWNRSEPPLFVLSELLQAQDWVAQTRPITTAKVPVIKFTVKPLQYSVDVVLNETSGLGTTERTNILLAAHPPLKALVLVLKYLLWQNNLNEPFSGGLGSYPLVILVASYLQCRKRTQLLEGCCTNRNDATLGSMLLEILFLFGTKFDFQHYGISLSGGGQWAHKSRLGFPYDFLVLVDPENSQNNVGLSCFNFFAVIELFKKTYYTLVANEASCSEPTLLRTILVPDDSIRRERDMVSGPEDELLPRKS